MNFIVFVLLDLPMSKLDFKLNYCRSSCTRSGPTRVSSLSDKCAMEDDDNSFR